MPLQTTTPRRKFTDGKYRINLLFSGDKFPKSYSNATNIFVDGLFVQFIDDRGGFMFFKRELIDSFYVIKTSD